MDLATRLSSRDGAPMKSIRLPSPIAALFVLVLSAAAQAEIDSKAQEVFDRYAEALGGHEAYDKIETARMRMSMEMPAMGMKMQMNVTYKKPDKIRINVEIPGMGSTSQGFDGEKGWSIDPMQGRRELVGSELEKMKEDSDFQEGLKLAEKYESATVTGTTEDELIIVTGTSRDTGAEETLYFEGETGLLKMSETLESMGPQGEMPVNTRYMAYTAFGDLLIPAHLEADMMGMSMGIKIESFEPNVEVDEAIFTMPE